MVHRMRFALVFATVLLGLTLSGRASAQPTTCNHYRMHPNGCACGTPCICNECILCDS